MTNQKKSLASFYRMRAGQYLSLLASETNKALAGRWARQARRYFEKAQQLEMAI